jgi:hypothetical protein
MGFKSSEFDRESLFDIAQTNYIIPVSISKWYRIIAGTSTFISFLDQSFSRQVNKKQEVGQIGLRWQLHSHRKVRTRLKKCTIRLYSMWQNRLI